MYTPDEVIAFFASRVRTHGPHPAACDWSASGQLLRFQALDRALPGRTTQNTLDLGCGLGDFPAATGVDACHAMLAQAHKAHPEREYLCANALTAELPRRAYVVSSGMLNLHTETNLDDMARLLAVAWESCTTACAITMLSDWAPDPKPERFYYPVDWVLDTARTLSPKVRLDHSYLPHDLTVSLYR